MDELSELDLAGAPVHSEQACSNNPFAGCDDTCLIDACLQQNDQAWEALLTRYSRLIYTIPLRFGFSPGVADEVFQETCLILLERLETLQQPERLSAWLVTVCRRICIQRVRQNKIPVESLDVLEQQTALPTEETSYESQLLLVEEVHLIHRAVESLPPRCRRMLKARYFSNPPRSYEMVARELGIPLGSIGPTRARCLEKLRQAILELEQYPPITEAEETEI